MKDTVSEITTHVKKSLFSPENLLKAAYFFVESYYIHFDDEGEDWVVSFTPKDGCNAGNRKIVDEFENELLVQAVRIAVYKRTSPLREMLMARAMTSTVVDEEDPIERIQAAQDDVSDDELKSILTDWFESHEE